MRKNLAKKIGYPVQDFIKSTDILKTLKLLRESQYWDEEQIMDYQSSKLKSLIEFSYKYVPYYEETFNKIKLKPSDISSLEDLSKIPILTKDIVRKNNMKLVRRGLDLRYVKIGKTGGTTGAPILVYKDNKTRSFSWASYYRWYEWMGFNYYDSIATLWGAKTVTKKPPVAFIVEKVSNYLQNEIKIDAFELSNKYNWVVYKKLINFKPRLIKGYVSALLDFGSFLNQNKLFGIKPDALSSTTETLLPHNRLFLSKIFNAPIYDQYGCGELPAISYECPAHNGLHVNMEHILCEILDEDDNPIFDRVGRVVGTDLDNYAMPFIRYENGDLSSVTNRKCDCGVNQLLMGSIDGRTSDTIVLKSGKKVHGVYFTDILYELGILTDKVQKFQVYQNYPGEIDFRIQCEKQLDKEVKNRLLKYLSKAFNKVNYSEHRSLINESNGKFRYIINDIK